MILRTDPCAPVFRDSRHAGSELEEKPKQSGHRASTHAASYVASRVQGLVPTAYRCLRVRKRREKLPFQSQRACGGTSAGTLHRHTCNIAHMHLYLYPRYTVLENVTPMSEEGSCRSNVQ